MYIFIYICIHVYIHIYITYTCTYTDVSHETHAPNIQHVQPNAHRIALEISRLFHEMVFSTGLTKIPPMGSLIME